MKTGKVFPIYPETTRAQWEINPSDLPRAVRDSIESGWEKPHEVYEALAYSPLHGCYCIGWAGMFVGIEDDGYTHT